MATVKKFRARIFWRYQKVVFRRARSRWWKTRGKHWWAEVTAAATPLLLRLADGADTEWWFSVAGVIGGGTVGAVLVFLYQLVAASALIDQEKTERIERLSGQLTDEDVARSQKQRVDLYKRILRLAGRWGDLSAVVEDNPASRLARESLEALRVDVEEVSDLVSFSDAWWGEKYAPEIDTIRRSLLVETEPRAAVECLREPIRRLKDIAEIDRRWDLERKPDTDEVTTP